MKKFIEIFKFPRPELQTSWWYRLSKVLILLLTIVAFGIAIRNSYMFSPYYVSSYDSKFDAYNEKSISLKSIPYDAHLNIVLDYQNSKLAGADNYIQNKFNNNESYDNIFYDMQRDGLTQNLLFKDLQYNNNEIYYKILYLTLFPVICYLLLMQICFRVLIYIIVGKKK